MILIVFFSIVTIFIYSRSGKKKQDHLARLVSGHYSIAREKVKAVMPDDPVKFVHHVKQKLETIQGTVNGALEKTRALVRLIPGRDGESTPTPAHSVHTTE